MHDRNTAQYSWQLVEFISVLIVALKGLSTLNYLISMRASMREQEKIVNSRLSHENPEYLADI